MRLKDLLRILLINSLFANGVNLLFLTDWTQRIWQTWQYGIGLGLVVYGLQAVMLYFLCKPYQKNLPFRKGLSLPSFAMGFSVAVAIWVVAQAAAVILNGAPVVYPTSEKLLRFLAVFGLNTIIGAFLEELVFRFLPVEYGRQAGLRKVQLGVLDLGTTGLFAITHLSAYLFRLQVQWDHLLGSLLNPFVTGLVMVLMYRATRNLYFIAFLHAFTNNDLYLVETPYSFLTCLTVVALWFAVRYMKNRTTRRLTT
ncbi:type II CAAX prenyl endopeptidase Rce1 family protein [Larkinella bovis]|uniref:Type II CAAX prenyl endopeptidase Rce1 family protein n=1 Tax=Larkinella bovis TaxID=683041 RepID=A0ABW0I7A2_9BACT